MHQDSHFLVFSINGQKIAIGLSHVDRVVLAAEITRLPESPPLVLGVVKVRNEVIPVLDLRKLLGIPEKEIEITDQFVLARSNNRKVALLVDSVEDVVEVGGAKVVESESIYPGISGIEGVFDGGGNVVLVEDFEKLLSRHDIALQNSAEKGKTNHSSVPEKT